MRTKTDNRSPFEVELGYEIQRTIRRLQADGTVGMSLTNLRAVVRPPNHLDGAPRGTNARYFYCEMFDRVATDVAGSFVY